MASWTEHVPPTHKQEDCVCGGMHADEGLDRSDVVCPACDGVYVVHVEEEDERTKRKR